MRQRGGTASIVASPVLVGAVTVLVSIVAVFLAYNANQGLPFVPTYDLSAQLPGGANLVKGNEVRVGGFRVGLVERIRPGTLEIGGSQRAVAVIDMKLDQVVKPLARDTVVIVRPRSALGLKYVELTPGRSAQMLTAGDTIPLANARERVEFDDVFSTFDRAARDNSRTSLTGYGNALAARGASLNRAIEALNPFFEHLTPVMRTLSDPETELDEFFKQIGRASAQVAPVAGVQADLFVNMADTFEAFSRSPESLRQTIAKSPPTLDASIASFRVQRPFLADFAVASRRLRPAARELRRSLPTINDALVVGQPVLRRSVDLNRRTQRVFAALDDLAEEPNTLLALKDLTTTVTVGRPLLEFVAPYQTVCNYWNFFWNGLSEHLSEGVPGGTIQRTLANGAANRNQDNRTSDTVNDRPADVPSNIDPQAELSPDQALQLGGQHLEVLHGQPYSPAIDAQGNADCQVGQTGYLDGPLDGDGRYPETPLRPGESINAWAARAGGGSHLVIDSDTPGLAGPTQRGLWKGVKNLRDVP